MDVGVRTRPDAVCVRAARTSDVFEIARIHRVARAKAMPWLPVVHSVEDEFVYFSETVLPTQTVCVVDFNDVAVGFIAFDEDWLNHLYIDPIYWRFGFGGCLLSEAMRQSDFLQLWTFQKNLAARQFYEKHGFEEVTFTQGARNEERVPDVRLTWTAPDA